MDLNPTREKESLSWFLSLHESARGLKLIAVGLKSNQREMRKYTYAWSVRIFATHPHFIIFGLVQSGMERTYKLLNSNATHTFVVLGKKLERRTFYAAF